MTTPLVILIHGTFAQKADWTQPGSLVRRQLKEKLGPDTQFLTFTWSGKNSPQARDHAGTTLAYRLKDHARRYPDAGS